MYSSVPMWLPSGNSNSRRRSQCQVVEWRRRRSIATLAGALGWKQPNAKPQPSSKASSHNSQTASLCSWRPLRFGPGSAESAQSADVTSNSRERCAASGKRPVQHSPKHWVKHSPKHWGMHWVKHWGMHSPKHWVKHWVKHWGKHWGKRWVKHRVMHSPMDWVKHWAKHSPRHWGKHSP